jgi:polysaccharide export outer membrane protein
MNRNIRIASFFTLSLLLQLTPLHRASAQSAQRTDEPRLVTRPRYTIQPGDKFDVVYRYTPELNQTVTVGPDGYVDIDSTGPLKVSDLTVEQATERITLLSAKRLREPKITLTLKEFHKPYYVVAGEVKHPGRFDMDQPTTALQALLLAGGMDASARSSQIIVFRRIDTTNDEVHVLDLHNVKKRSDLERDLMLEPGDMLLVPRNRLANIERVIKAANVGLYLNPGSMGF